MSRPRPRLRLRPLTLLVLALALGLMAGAGWALISRGLDGEAPGRLQPGQVLRLPPEPPPPPVQIPVPPRVVSRAPAGRGMVALTFDAGWEYEPALPLLDVLRQHQLRVTFFPRGKWLEDHPQLLARILADGHEVGSHSHTHPDLTKISPERVEAEIALAKQALVRLAGERAFLPFYRPPYGAHNEVVNAALARHGYGWVVMWQVDSLDWQPQSTPESITARVLGRLTDGGIALLHVGTHKTVQALPAILEGLAQRNLRVVRVSELLGLEFNPPPPPERTYVVRAGDTLEGIAGAHGITVERLLELNPDLRGR